MDSIEYFDQDIFGDKKHKSTYINLYIRNNHNKGKGVIL